MNMFDYSFEYLIVHFTGSESNSVEIGNVQGIYALDASAKREMANSFDSRIQIHVSPWTAKMQALRKELFIRQSMKGVDNLWTIFGLTEEDKEKCKAIITKEIIEEVFGELFDNTRPIGELPLWVYLMRYERHSFYPKDMRGFFCDCIHSVCNWMQKKEILEDVAETTNIYKSIISAKPEFAPLAEIMSASPLAIKTAETAKSRFVIAAPLFLFMKDIFSDGIKMVDKRFIEYAKEIGIIECSIAVFLLGLTLGYDKTYDAYYDNVKLPIFKKREVPIDDEPKTTTPNLDDIKPNEPTSTFIAVMYKGRRNTKAYDCKGVSTPEEKSKLESQGYKAYADLKKGIQILHEWSLSLEKEKELSLFNK